MRISDWSSDVCSSDLLAVEEGADAGRETAELGHSIGAGPMPEAAGVIGEAREPLARGEIEFGAVVRDARRIPQRIGLDCAEDRKSTTSELQSLMRISYAVFCLKKKKTNIIVICMQYYTVHNNIHTRKR